MFPPVTTTATGRPSQRGDSSRPDRGDAHGSRPFGHDLIVGEQGDDRVLGLRLRHLDDLVDEVAMGEDDVADAPGDPVGDRGARGVLVDRVAHPERLAQGRGRFGLYRHDAHVRPHVLHVRGDSGDEAATAARDDDGADVGELLEDLRRRWSPGRRPCAGRRRRGRTWRRSPRPRAGRRHRRRRRSLRPPAPRPGSRAASRPWRGAPSPGRRAWCGGDRPGPGPRRRPPARDFPPTRRRFPAPAPRGRATRGR